MYMNYLNMKRETPCYAETMQSSQPSSLRIALVDTLWHLGPAFQRWAESRTQDGLSAQRLRILSLLNEHGPLIMRELTRLLGVTATNVTALIDALEKEDLVCRRPHPTDRRATLLDLTPAAAARLQTGCAAYRQRVAEVFADLSEDECCELQQLLERVRTRLESEGV